VTVGGDFTDLEMSSADYNYFGGDSATNFGNFVFNGGAATQRTLTVNRTGITRTSFHVGLDAANPGNVRLGADLATQSNFIVRENALFDTADFTVTAGTVVVEDGAVLTYSFSDADTGLISASDAGIGAG